VAFDSPVVVRWWTNPGRLEVGAAYRGAVRVGLAVDAASRRALIGMAHAPYAVGSSFRVVEDAPLEAQGAPRAGRGGRAPAAAAGKGEAAAAGGGDDEGARTPRGPTGATLLFAFETAGGDGGDAELVTMVLPHHAAALAGGASVWGEGPTFASIKGQMVAVRGAEWGVHEAYAPISWLAPRPPAPELLPMLRSALRRDLTQPTVLAPDARVRAARRLSCALTRARESARA
jgi:hypothetical protein